ncbi:unnamed protein product, partial [Brugia timori]|uniref:GPS domain-containing protein n=1 Tax=Brugia timori TaxID=42155 RepID=A0A0R3QC88_9BILA
EVSKLPYGSYSVPDSTSSQCISRQGKFLFFTELANRTLIWFDCDCVNDIGNHRNSNENFEKPSASEFPATVLFFVLMDYIPLLAAIIFYNFCGKK